MVLAVRGIAKEPVTPKETSCYFLSFICQRLYPGYILRAAVEAQNLYGLGRAQHFPLRQEPKAESCWYGKLR